MVSIMGKKPLQIKFSELKDEDFDTLPGDTIVTFEDYDELMDEDYWDEMIKRLEEKEAANEKNSKDT